MSQYRSDAQFLYSSPDYLAIAIVMNKLPDTGSFPVDFAIGIMNDTFNVSRENKRKSADIMATMIRYYNYVTRMNLPEEETPKTNT